MISNSNTVPLARALSKLGVMSRTEAIDRVLAGDVTVGGRVVRDPGHRVVPETARIVVGGETIARQAPVVLMLHKPRGVVTTRSDPQGRPTVYSLLDGVRQHLSPVGRLDLASTGLLLLTNDTRLASWLLDPATAVSRTYVVTVRGELLDETLVRIERGVRDRGELLRAESIQVLKRSKRETHVTVVLAEGKNRELRRMLAACGHEVTRLKRIAFGSLPLGSLKPGEWRIVAPGELETAFPGAPLRTANARRRSSHRT